MRRLLILALTALLVGCSITGSSEEADTVLRIRAEGWDYGWYMVAKDADVDKYRIGEDESREYREGEGILRPSLPPDSSMITWVRKRRLERASLEVYKDETGGLIRKEETTEKGIIRIRIEGGSLEAQAKIYD